MNTSILHVPISDLIKEKPALITVDSRLSVPSAFKILAQNNIYSAPVVNKETGECFGFIDMVDIMTVIVHIFDEQHRKKHEVANASQPNPEQTDDFYVLLEQVEKFDLTHVDQVVDISKRNPMCPIRSKAPLQEALEIFSKTGVHRLPVLDETKSLCHILSQSDVINWLAANVAGLGDFKSRTVRELGVGFKDVISVTTDTPVMDSFRLMVQKKISGLAVIEKKDGTLFTHLSAKDIKLVAQEALFTKLYKSTFEFVQSVRAKALKAYFPVVYVHPEISLSHLLEKFSVLKIHRVYIIDDHKKPIGVISLGDVIALLVNEKETRILK